MLSKDLSKTRVQQIKQQVLSKEGQRNKSEEETTMKKKSTIVYAKKKGVGFAKNTRKKRESLKKKGVKYETF